MERSRNVARWGTPFVVAIGLTLGSGQVASAQPCEVPDDGSGTVSLPPEGCEYLSPDEFHMIVDGLPPGTTIEIAPIHRDFICKQGGGPHCGVPGGNLDGEVEFFVSTIELQMQGTGDLAGFQRNIQVSLFCETHTGPRIPGDPVQTFPNEMVQLQGAIFGDPDFDQLNIVGGTGFGLPSPGQTTLTRLGPPGSNFQVDSFFDITYRIDFQGAPGSVLEGMAGTTQGTVRMEAMGAGGDCAPDPTGQGCEPVACPDPNQICLPTCVNFDPGTGAIRVLACDCRFPDECHVQIPGGPAPGPVDPCLEPDNGTGTVTLPPAGCEYLSPDEVHLIIDGLPAGTTIELAPIHKDFICQKGMQSCSVPIPPGECEAPGGNLGGHVDCFTSVLEVQLTGTGLLAGYVRNLSIPLETEVHTGPRNPGDGIQDFDTDMVRIQGELFGDPDFCILRVRGGRDFGLPSPGHTTLTRLGPPGSDFQVDSFFDVFYQIEFQGCPGSILDGFGGITTAPIRMVASGGGGLPPCVGGCPPGTECFQEITQLADGTFDICCECVPVSAEGACCFDSNGDGINDACQLTTPNGCQAIGGTYQGDGTVCLGIAACCFDADGDGLAEACADMDIICCEAIGGTFTAGAARFGQGACCFDPDGDGIQDACAIMDGVCCALIGGSFKGPGVPCLGRGACCFDADGDGIPESCADMDEICCESFGGTFLGIGSVCLGDSNGDGADDACVPPQLEGACCFDAEGDGIPETCVITTFQQCVNLGGTYKGDGSTCLGVGACCFDPDGDGLQDRCVEMDEICCESIGGTFKGPGAPCLGPGACCFDTNGDNIQDACVVMDGICCESFGGTFKGPGSMCLGQGACCFDPDGDGIQDRCVEMDGICCESFGGTFKGPGSMCLGQGACCIPVGTLITCVEMDEICCESSGGMFLGFNTVCLGDSDGDGNDDACVPPECGPNAAQTDCLPIACPDPNHICLPVCANFDPGTGALRVIQCDCLPPDHCHLDISGIPAPGPNPCSVPDNGSGTVTLPPAGCEYLSPDEVHLIIDGLPAGTTIELAPIHKDFICQKGDPNCTIPIPPGECEAPGGNLGGSGDCFQSTLELQVTGTGDLAGFNRTLFVPISCEVHTAPRNPGDAVQDFDTEMVQLQGELFGDPDFCAFRVRGGTNLGLPSPGHTTLTRLGPPGSDFQVDSFFDVFYEIDFVGCPGSVLEGFAGTTQAVIRMQTGAGGGVPPCVGDCPPGTECVQTIITLADGTLDVCCDCIPIEPEGACCFDADSDGINESCTVTTQTGCVELAGGTYQGDGTVCLGIGACCFGITGGACAVMDEICCDDLSGGFFLGVGTVCLGDANGDGQDDACIPPDCGPNIDESACLQVVCPDDPAHQCLPREVIFDPFTGQVRVTVCECIDVNECHVVTLGDPIACPPAPVGGNSCVEPDAGGTVIMPPASCGYVSPEDAHMIIDGLPPGTTIIVGAEHTKFGLQNSGPGGNLGGEFEQFSSLLQLQICGTGDLGGFNRFVNVPIDCETHIGPRTPGDAVQSFDTDFFRLQGEIFGDPDFDLLKVTGGTAFGLPSPGHTTLTRLGPPGSNFVVDSFFDITYQIEFIGTPGGTLDGLAGTTQATIRMKTGGVPACVGGCPPGQICERSEVVQADGTIRIRCDCVDDVPPCPWDFDGDGSVGFQDLLKILAQWGPCPAPCPWDFDGDGVVGFQDLLKILAQWGPCPT